MWSMSAQFLDAMRTSHRMAAKAEWYMDGAWQEMSLVEGSVSADYYSLVMRTFQGTISPSVSSVADRERLESLAPLLYGTYVRTYRGVTYPNGEVEMAPLGVFVIETFDRETGGAYSLSLSGSDLYAQVNRARMEVPRSVSGPSRIEVCKSLVSEALDPNLPWGPVVFRVLPGVVDSNLRSTLVERDRGTSIRDILAGAGIRGYFAADGAFEFAPQIKEDAPAVWSVSTGDKGTLIAAKESAARERIYNIVVAIGESSDETVPPVVATARDDNPDSPTYWQGPFGKVPYFYSSQFMYTEAQAQAVADSLLPTVRGAASAYDVTTTPNPALAPGDAITVQMAGQEASTETHIISTYSVPLQAQGEMSMSTQLLKAATGGTPASWPRLRL